MSTSVGKSLSPLRQFLDSKVLGNCSLDICRETEKPPAAGGRLLSIIKQVGGRVSLVLPGFYAILLYLIE